MASLDVLIPHFNAPEDLSVSLRSVAAQDWQGSVRVVVVDDGSKREARAQAARVLETFPGASTFIELAQNRGRPFTRNRLLEAVGGTHVAWLDAGDWWYPEKIRLQFEALNLAPEAHVWATCDYDWKWTGREATPTVQNIDGDQIAALLRGDRLRAYLWTLVTPVSTLEKVGSFDESLPRLQDLDYFLRFLVGGGRLIKPAESSPLCRYEKSDLGRAAREVRLCQERIFEKHDSVYRRYGKGFLRSCRVKADLHAARYALNNGSYAEFGRFIGRAVLRDPLGASRWLLRKTMDR